jgi:hypothetical protein
VLPLGTAHEERAVYVVSGAVNIGRDRFPSGQFLVLRPDVMTVRNAEDEATRLVLVGGETMDGLRHIWWNFVSSRVDRIEQARADWKAGRFDTVPCDAEEFIPLQADEVASYPQWYENRGAITGKQNHRQSAVKCRHCRESRMDGR